MKIIGERAFNDAGKLQMVDLSSTQVEVIGEGAFIGCKSLALFKGSKSLNRINSYDAFDFRNVVDAVGFEGNLLTTGYFYTPEQPNNLRLGAFKEIHIPRGSKAGWPGTSSSVIIDDIEE